MSEAAHADTSGEARRYYDPARGIAVIGATAIQDFLAHGGQQESLKELDYTNYYYDLSSMRFLIGDMALEEHYESGGHAAEIYNLAGLIVNRDIEIPRQSPTPGDYEVWSREDFIIYGKWLQGLVQTQGSSDKLVFEHIKRANNLGIGPSYQQIYYRFGMGATNRINEFYEEIGREAPKWGVFSKWRVRDFVCHMDTVIEEEREKPTEPVMERRRAEGKIDPSYDIIANKVGTPATLLELNGYMNTRAWEDIDYIDWGIKYRLANNGQMPRASTLVRYAKQKRGPSPPAVMSRFGGIAAYQKLLRGGYKAQQLKREKELADMHYKLWYNIVPPEAINGARSDSQMLRQYGKYQLLNNSDFPVLQELDESRKIKLCRKYKDLDFIIKLISIHEDAGIKDIPSVVSQLLVTRRRLYLDSFMENLSDETVAA